MGFVYLIESYNTQHYKIGVSKNDPKKRLKQLATGNADELRLISEYKTNNYRKLEKWLHRKYDYVRLEGEWFALNDYDVINFTKTCDEANNTIITLLRENPFYN